MGAIGRHLITVIVISVFALNAATAEDNSSKESNKTEKLTIAPHSISESDNSEDPEKEAEEKEDLEKALMKAVAETQKEEEKKKKDESEIPVLTGIKDKKTAESSPYMRMALSLLVILVAAIGMLIFARWWRKNSKLDSSTTKIQVLTQHYLGPKKSLAIVRVAGESILIGVTDNNISHIKTLSLIDEEVPEKVPEHFEESLQSSEKEADQIGSIKNHISDRLKEMRSL